MSVFRPSLAPYTAAARPAGPAADDDEVVERQRRMGRHPDGVGEVPVRGVAQDAVVGQDDDRAGRVDGLVERGRQAAAVLIGLRVEPGVGHLVAGQEVADLVAARGPSAAQEAQPLERRSVAGGPVGEQVVEDRVELLVGRIPGLEEVLVEADLVDRADGDVGVGVGGQQDALRLGLERDRLGEELGAGHRRHALVDEEERHRIAALGQLAHDLERIGPGAGTDDPVVVGIARAQVTLDGPQDGRVVVDREDCRLGDHAASVPTARRYAASMLAPGTMLLTGSGRLAPAGISPWAIQVRDGRIAWVGSAVGRAIRRRARRPRLRTRHARPRRQPHPPGLRRRPIRRGRRPPRGRALHRRRDPAHRRCHARRRRRDPRGAVRGAPARGPRRGHDHRRVQVRLRAVARRGAAPPPHHPARRRAAAGAGGRDLPRRACRPGGSRRCRPCRAASPTR